MMPGIPESEHQDLFGETFGRWRIAPSSRSRAGGSSHNIKSYPPLEHSIVGQFLLQEVSCRGALVGYVTGRGEKDLD